jgi:hypothetical protein
VHILGEQAPGGLQRIQVGLLGFAGLFLEIALDRGDRPVQSTLHVFQEQTGVARGQMAEIRALGVVDDVAAGLLEFAALEVDIALRGLAVALDLAKGVKRLDQREIEVRPVGNAVELVAVGARCTRKSGARVGAALVEAALDFRRQPDEGIGADPPSGIALHFLQQAARGFDHLLAFLDAGIGGQTHFHRLLQVDRLSLSGRSGQQYAGCQPEKLECVQSHCAFLPEPCRK